MSGAAVPFGAWPPRGLPGEHWPGLSCGHRVYRGAGGIGSVDFARPVGLAQCDAARLRLPGLGHTPSTRYTYVVRPVAGTTWLETPDLANACEVRIGPDGDWLGSRPAAVEWISAAVEAQGAVRVRWSYRTPPGCSAPASFGIYCATGPRIAAGSPSAVVDYAADGLASHVFALADGVSYWLAVTARDAAGRESRLSRAIGPFVADASAPAVASATVGRTF